jgi:hypothetical protein
MENSTLDNAGSLYDRATDPGSGTFCDARNGLHYMLMRLSLAGLTTDEQEQLLELGAQTFSGGDADNVASKIISNEQATPLALAIASIVQKSRLSKKMAMLGSVFGAYSALGEPTFSDHRPQNLVGRGRNALRRRLCPTISASEL